MRQLAFRGCLIAAILVFPNASHGQESTPESTAPVEESQGIAPDAPTPQENRQEEPAGQQDPAAETSQGVLAIQKQRAAKPTCDARCKAAEQREKDDLMAQESMARSAWDLVDLTFWQIIVGGVGISLLIVTLYFTRQSTKAAISASKAAQDSVQVASDTAKHQLRAYVGVEGARITMTNEGELSYRITYKNFGQTPASKVMARTTFTATPLPLIGTLPAETNPTPPISVGVLWPDQTAPKNDFMKKPGMTKPGQFTPEYRDDIATSRAGIFLHGEITYEDIFRDSHRTKFQFIYTGEWGGDRNLIICEEGNEAT